MYQSSQGFIFCTGVARVSMWVALAPAGLQDRIKQQLTQKRGITTFQYRTATSEREARKLEKQYRDRLNPKQKRV